MDMCLWLMRVLCLHQFNKLLVLKLLQKTGRKKFQGLIYEVTQCV